jgi:dihydroorotate dehydrogenase
LVVANRFFRKYIDKETGEEYFTAHGGKELRILNQKQVREIRKAVDLPISATGGTYSGRHVAEYLEIGAQNVQVLTYVMKNGFERAFRNLMFDPENGFINLALKKEN